VSEIAAALGDQLETRWVRLDGAGDAERPRVALSSEERAALAAGDVGRVERHTDDGEVRRNVYVPMAAREPTLLEASESLQRQRKFVDMSHTMMALATIVVATVCGLIAIALGVRFVGWPVRLIAEQARRMGAGDFSRRLDIDQHDEIGELSKEMNGLCDRLVAARDAVTAATEARVVALEQLRHADRLATVGQLASGVAHELGTPLSVVAARAGLLRAGDASAAEVAESGTVIAEQAARMTAIIRQLLDLSRRRGPQLGVADLRGVVTRTAELLSSMARGRGVTLDLVMQSTPLLAEIDVNQLQQALAHVVVNAVQAMPKSGRVEIAARTCRARPPVDGAPEDDYACVTVEDEGTGIDPAQLRRVFEPFFTTKDVGEGTGLGLSVAEGIVTDHKGWIAVASVPGQGSRFDIYLPLAKGAEQSESPWPPM
jgi:signal transduction histidine kinase